MKRLAIALVLILCAVWAFPCSAELAAGDRAMMLEQTAGLTALMAECAGIDAYAKLYVAGNSGVMEVIRKIARADWGEYRGGTVYVLKDGAIEAFLSAAGLSLADFPPAPAAKVRQTIVSSIPSAVAGQSGSDFLAAASTLRTGTVFRADVGFPEFALVFLQYNADYAVLCSFVRSGEDLVSASLVPVPADSEAMLKRVMGLKLLFGGHDSLYDEYSLR